MSKYVKQLVTDDLRGRLEGVEEVLLVDVIGMDATTNNRLRGALTEKSMNLLVVKNSLARRATEGTPLAPAFEGIRGSMALVWGGDDFVSLAKEIVRLAKDKAYEKLVPTGGVMDGEQLSAERVQEVSKWPSRQEQLSLLVGQMLSPGAALSSQLISSGGALASQIEKISEAEDSAAEDNPAE
ncbi:MAG: 50S ribosomal protein L10 [Planctomycetes bacterium]|nr:50S ribosomal protein L10 [Planctomycetota bacterium]